MNTKYSKHLQKYCLLLFSFLLLLVFSKQVEAQEIFIDNIKCYYNDYDNACDSLELYVKDENIRKKCLQYSYYKSYKCSFTAYSENAKRKFKNVILTKNAINFLLYDYDKNYFLNEKKFYLNKRITQIYIFLFLLLSFLVGLLILV